jgi:hypothetical protein
MRAQAVRVEPVRQRVGDAARLCCGHAGAPQLRLQLARVVPRLAARAERDTYQRGKKHSTDEHPASVDADVGSLPMLCSNCGHDSSEGSRYCARCGSALTAAATPDAPSDAPTADPAPPATPNPWAAPKPWGAPTGAEAVSPSPGPYAAPPPPPPYAPQPTSAASNPYAPPNPYAPNAYAPPNPYAPPGYGQCPPGPYPRYGSSANSLAVASLILGLVGWTLCGVGSIVAVVLGFVARSQIKASGGRQSGEGMALAGIVLGCIGIALMALFIVLSVANGDSS